MKCEYCDNPVPNGVTRCPSCGAAVISYQANSSTSCQQDPSGNHVGTGTRNEADRQYVVREVELVERKSRVCFVLLGILLGEFGIHNFYVSYILRGVCQLLITVLSFGLLCWVSWIWAIIEIITVKRDGHGVAFSNESI